MQLKQFLSKIQLNPHQNNQNKTLSVTKQYIQVSQNIQKIVINKQKQIQFQMNMSQTDDLRKTTGMFLLGKEIMAPAEYIYDQTYKNYKMKQKFQKDPKFSYFNAVMQIKQKLSSKQQVYKKVFETKQNQDSNIDSEARKTLYLSNLNPINLINLLPETQVIRIQRLKNNSFKIMKQQPSVDTLMNKNRHKYNNNDLLSMNRTRAVSLKSGNKVGNSLFQRNSSQNTQNSHISFQLSTKAHNIKSHIQLQGVTQKQRQSNYIHQSFNPKPRLDQIMSQYRKMNHHSHFPKSRKSSLPKQFMQKLYVTNKMFYSNRQRKKSPLY